MKKLSFLAMAAFGLLFAACSSDKDVADQGGSDQEDANQFIALAIDLPTTNALATRSSETDDNNYGDTTFELNDGLASEYTVNDATLVVFRPAGTDENDATFVAAFNLNPEPWTDPADKQVTKTSAKIVQKVGSTVAAGDLALVILNKNNIVGFSGTTFQLGGADVAVGMKFKAFKETLISAAALGAAEMTSNGFFMANAPLTDKQGSTTTALTGATVRTLIPIDNVYETEADALAGEPAHIYVERGMAKVTLQALSASLKLDTEVDGSKPAVTFVNWTIDQTNKSSYVVRSTEGHADFLGLVNQVANKYRYAGMSDITEGSPATYKYRTYFAKDPNYEGTLTPSTYMNYAADGDYTAAVGDANPKYCFENTFDVEHQTVQNTTLARLKVTVGTGIDLYIVNGNRGTIYKKDGVATLAANAAIAAISAAASLGSITVSGTVTAADFDITVPTTAGAATPTIAWKSGVMATRITAGTFADADLQTAVNKSLSEVLCYAGGTSYYTIRIKHFGDQLCPWHTGLATETPAPEVGNIYPAATANTNYLGRYGVLRNNWYDIRINSIKYLGEPTPKDYKDDPTTDDELDGYISAQIHILSWAKRVQAWDL